MLENSNMLDLAVEQALEKSTSNARAHISAATMSQEDHDKHADALAHHAGAIEYYRNKPEVKSLLEKINREAVPLREFVNKPLKLEGGSAPQITADDLNKAHPKLQGRTDHESIAGAINNKLSELHKAFNSNPDIKALSSHSKRFLAHMSAMLEWHNLQKKGEGAHHQFVGKVEGPELQGNYENSKYRGHSTPSATDRTKFRTQSITKQGGAKWHPGLPELTSLEEAGGHPSSGKPKELYPFREIKVNGQALQPHTFTEEAKPAQIHAQDYATNLTKDHQVIAPGEQSPTQAMGGYHGTKGAAQNAANMERVGLFKKSLETDICSYFPNVTRAHYVLAKNLLSTLNPFGDMDDESFGDYVVSAMTNTDSTVSTCAAILAEAESRLEKAKKDEESKPRPALLNRDWHKGVEDVMSGKVLPLPHMMEATERSKKDEEKRSELEDLGYQPGQRKRSPYAVPKEVFTDDTYTKIDPEKYKEWVHGPMTEQDLRNEHATYNSVIKYNPEAQKRHKAYVDMERESSREKLGRATMGFDEEKPHLDHKAILAQAGKDLQAGKITPQEFAQISAESAKKKASLTSRKAASSDLTPEEQRVKEADPTYQPRRAGVGEQAAASSEKDLLSIAHGNVPSHLIPDKESMGSILGDMHGDAQAREITHQRGGEDGDQGMTVGGISQVPSPIQLINEHPGFKNYLKFKEHMLSHYKSPEVRKYMEDKINQHENDPNMDPDKLAGIYHLLHRAKDQAMREHAGQSKMLRDIVGAPETPAAAETPEPAGEPSAEEMKQKVQQYMSTRPTKESMPTPSNVPEPPKEEVKPAAPAGAAPKTIIRRPAKQ